MTKNNIIAIENAYAVITATGSVVSAIDDTQFVTDSQAYAADCLRRRITNSKTLVMVIVGPKGNSDGK